MGHAFMHALFPCVVEVPGTRLQVVVLDSNVISDNITTNALGRIGDEQLAALAKVIDLLEAEGTPFVIAMHHHVALPTRRRAGFRDAFENRVLACEDGAFLIAHLSGSRDRVVFHGHRHVRYEQSVGEHVHIISAPSTTLGNVWREEPLAPGTSDAGFLLVTATWDFTGVRVAELKSCESSFRVA